MENVRDQVWLDHLKRSRIGTKETHEAVLVCPVCQGEHVYLDFDKQAVFCGHGDYQTPTQYRGDALIVQGFCEQGHDVELVLATHKGQTIQHVREARHGMYLRHVRDGIERNQP
jgi:uncharacterized protein YbaR (Trm112 family)